MKRVGTAAAYLGVFTVQIAEFVFKERKVAALAGAVHHLVKEVFELLGVKVCGRVVRGPLLVVVQILQVVPLVVRLLTIIPHTLKSV